jgi:DNA polymerase I
MFDAFREIWMVDFEFVADRGERPEPICLVAWELRSGRELRLWRGQFGPTPPYSVDAGSLFVAYYASAELGCHLALGWPMPARILDLYVEFRSRTNGLETPAGAGLLGALTYFGLDSMAVAAKDSMRALVLRGGPWMDDEKGRILDYCENDVSALNRLLGVMQARIDLPRALFRGRYMAAAAGMELNGVPIDRGMLEGIRLYWTNIQDQLIDAIDADYHVFDNRTFRADRFAVWLTRSGIPWPRLGSGALDLSDDTFRQMARIYHSVAPLRELRSTLSELRLSDLAVGWDGRNRTILSAFRARTGRNQPSNSKFIFGPSVWLRGLIKPPPGHGVAYVDWSQQEFGIAAALSGDEAMKAAYRSGDPYLAFAKQAGAVPLDATKSSHGAERELYKTCVLGVQFGMTEFGLTLRTGQPSLVARHLLQQHRETYRTFWRWSDAAVDQAVSTGKLHTVFGWHIHVDANYNARSLRNFPMQANGAEMLRLACCLAIERGIEVCAPVHDALLICAPVDRLEADIAVTQAAMAEASRVVLDSFELRTGVETTRFPDRYMDPRGARMWNHVQRLIEKADRAPRGLFG